MGPYCRFCGHRCFRRVPDEYIKDYPGDLPLMATCKEGMEYETKKYGISFDQVKEKATGLSSRPPQS